MLVSVVISFRNEEKNIPELVKRINNSINSFKVTNKSHAKLEMIFVNDDSTDNSFKILKSYKKLTPLL